MNARDEGATHHFGDDCPGGHRAANVAGVDWDDQETAAEANAREAAERDSAALVPVEISDEMVEAFLALQTARIDGIERVRAGLAAVVPLIRAQVAAEQSGYEPFVAAGPDERTYDLGYLSLPAEIQAEAERAVSAGTPTTEERTDGTAQWTIRDADGNTGDYADDERAIRQSWAQGITWWDPDGTYELCRRDGASGPWEVVERHPVVSDDADG